MSAIELTVTNAITYLMYRIQYMFGKYDHEPAWSYAEWCEIEYKGPTFLQYWSNPKYWHEWYKNQGWEKDDTQISGEKDGAIKTVHDDDLSNLKE